jgi:hypothetical protein
MRLTDAVLSRLVLIRVVPGLVILLYLFVATVGLSLYFALSRQEYVADVGTLLRQDVLFGIIALCIAWPLAGLGRHPEDEETGNRTGPLPDLTRPR